jgi:hypothetical protein
VTSTVYTRAKAYIQGNPALVSEWVGAIDRPETLWQVLPSELSARVFVPLQTGFRSWVFPGVLDLFLRKDRRGSNATCTDDDDEISDCSSISVATPIAPAPPPSDTFPEAVEIHLPPSTSTSRNASRRPSATLPEGKPEIPQLEMERVHEFQRAYLERIFGLPMDAPVCIAPSLPTSTEWRTSTEYLDSYSTNPPSLSERRPSEEGRPLTTEL